MKKSIALKLRAVNFGRHDLFGMLGRTFCLAILFVSTTSVPVFCQSNSQNASIKSETLKTVPSIPGLVDPFQTLLYGTLKQSLEADPEMRSIDERLAAYQNRFKNQAKPSADAMVNYKEGIAAVEGAAALLELKPQDLRSLCMAELAWEKRIDERFVLVENLFSGLVEAMNNDSYTNLDGFKAAFSNMVNLIGDQNATALVTQLASIRSNLDVSGASQAARKSFSAMEYSEWKNKLESMTQDSDPVLQNFLVQLNKQSQTKDVGGTQRLMSGALGLLSFVPGGVGDVADFAQMACDAGKGAEDAKLLHSVYLYKRVELRRRAVSDVIGQSLHNYELATRTGNAFLMNFAKSQVIDLAGPKAWEQLSLAE